ncbi:MAG: SUMF1/EgtB/PvdO family nonheme iron enzyme, partial [bacterium]
MRTRLLGLAILLCMIAAYSSALAVEPKVPPQPKDFKYKGKMIYILAGRFLMGNNGNEGYSSPRELPQHWVTLSGYWIGKYE